MKYRAWRLKEAIHVCGPSFWNTESSLTLEPLLPGDNRWLIEAYGADHEITPAMFYAFEGRTVALVVNDEVVLCEFEHIGFLYAFGLRGVRVRATGGLRKYWGRRSVWPPFMCQKELLFEVRDKCRFGGHLEPYAYPRTLERSRYQDLKDRTLQRSVCYTPKSDALCIEVLLDYGAKNRNKGKLLVSTDIHAPDLDTLVAAPTLVRPPSLLRVLQIFQRLPIAHFRRWPHGSKVHAHAGSDMKVTHVLLDKLLLSFKAPPDWYATGEFVCAASDHRLDVDVLQGMWEHRLAVIIRAA